MKRRYRKEPKYHEIQIPDKTERPSRDTGVITSFVFPIRKVPTPGLDNATYERRLNDGTQWSIPLLVNAGNRIVLGWVIGINGRWMSSSCKRVNPSNWTVNIFVLFGSFCSTFGDGTLLSIYGNEMSEKNAIFVSSNSYMKKSFIIIIRIIQWWQWRQTLLLLLLLFCRAWMHGLPTRIMPSFRCLFLEIFFHPTFFMLHVRLCSSSRQ